MGLIAHKVLIVTGWENGNLDMTTHFRQAFMAANRLFPKLISNIVDSNLNGYKAFVVAPDGSKEGWSESDDFDANMETMIGILRSSKCKYSDGSSSLDWFLAEYGETGRRILKSNCRNQY